VYFNNAEDYLSTAASTTTMLVGLGSDYGVFSAQSHNVGTTSTTRAIRKRTAVGNFKKGIPTRVAVGADARTWWLGRIQKIRH
jgi:hypothetical protein